MLHKLYSVPLCTRFLGDHVHEHAHAAAAPYKTEGVERFRFNGSRLTRWAIRSPPLAARRCSSSGSSSIVGGRRRRQPSPPKSSPSPPPSPTAPQQNLQFSTPSLAQRHWTISGGVIQSFGLTRNADNRWVHRNSPPPPQHQNQPPPQLQPPPPLLQQQTSSFDDVMRGINDLRTFVGDNFNTLNESMNARFEQLELNMGDRFDTIDARVEHVEHDIDYLRRHFGPHGGSSS
ncbi:hypothetical protein LR48_Vigan03g073200 [Vigna angularis]|uniref:Uncharacterized protein n=1 Tax=Phaseolus angularis TaxID=3914 RepID=A0A0L9U3I9_PHAAN|nr:hypothetical protein LR48_Vigan03g073200 [Vigna angularis]